MSESRFKDQMLGSFTTSDEVLRLQNLAKRYEEECEKFDRVVCSGKNGRGGVMPVTGYELQAINVNAQSVFRRISSENKDLEPGLIMKFIRRHN